MKKNFALRKSVLLGLLISVSFFLIYTVFFHSQYSELFFLKNHIKTENGAPSGNDFESPEEKFDIANEIKENIEKIEVIDEVQAENQTEVNSLEFNNSEIEAAKIENQTEGLKKGIIGDLPPLDLKSNQIPIKKNKLKIGFITDLHFGSDSHEYGRKIKDLDRRKVDYFLQQMNDFFQPNFILVNGDLIEGTGRSEKIGVGELEQCRAIFEQTTIPKFWVVGNHDLRSVSKKKFQEALKIDYLNKTFEVGDYQIILLDGSFYLDNSEMNPQKIFNQGKVPPVTRDWLEKNLKKNKKKKIVFIHYPLLSNNVSRKNILSNAEEVRGLLEDRGVLAVFSGHTEWIFKDKIKDISYFTLPGLTKNPNYLGSFAQIEIGERNVKVKLFYQKEEDGAYFSKAIN